ncbi:hypothetical protein [Mammaliicoccus vitulinus]|uniref:hypothetical protein n=1 Tax=Mammaliicoccus vitulinus TaxID=71237 RepID=UPI001E29ED82|nr:hypothetical protein [Mammaliicoccus vitulinus]
MNILMRKNAYYPSYIKMFNDLGGGKPLNPVILLFDNELQNKNKPLSKICNHINLSDNDKDILKLNLNLYLTENLYLLTHQLVGESKENELEDLFKDKNFIKNNR